MSYGKVHDVYWESERIATVDDRAALLGLFLISGPHRNAIGCFKLGMGALTDNERFKKWGIEGVSKGLLDLSAIGFIVRDERTGWTLIDNALKHDPIKGDKAAIHALSLTERVPRNTAVYQVLKEKLEPQLMPYAKALEGKPNWPMASPIDPPSDGVTIPKPSPSPLPEPSPEPQPVVADKASQAETPEAASLPFSELDSKGKSQRIMAVGHAVLAATGADPARWTGDFSIIGAWLSSGYDLDLDILPTVKRLLPRWGGNSLKFFTNAIEQAYRDRTTEIPAFLRRGDGQPPLQTVKVPELTQAAIDQRTKRIQREHAELAQNFDPTVADREIVEKWGHLAAMALPHLKREGQAA